MNFSLAKRARCCVGEKSSSVVHVVVIVPVGVIVAAVTANASGETGHVDVNVEGHVGCGRLPVSPLLHLNQYAIGKLDYHVFPLHVGHTDWRVRDLKVVFHDFTIPCNARNGVRGEALLLIIVPIARRLNHKHGVLHELPTEGKARHCGGRNSMKLLGLSPRLPTSISRHADSSICRLNLDVTVGGVDQPPMTRSEDWRKARTVEHRDVRVTTKTAPFRTVDRTVVFAFLRRACGWLFDEVIKLIVINLLFHVEELAILCSLEFLSAWILLHISHGANGSVGWLLEVDMGEGTTIRLQCPTFFELVSIHCGLIAI